MVEPEIYELLDWLTAEAAALGLTLLPEVHAERGHASARWRRAATGSTTSRCPLLTAARAQYRLGRAPSAPPAPSRRARQFTTLDTHDGIPVLPGPRRRTARRRRWQPLCPTASPAARTSAGCCRPPASRSTGSTRTRSTSPTTRRSAETRTRTCWPAALQLFAPGIPQVYYVGLLAGENDLAGVEATGEGRAINRRNYSEPEVEDAMRRPVVRRLLELVRLRAGHLAFLGEPEVTQEGASALSIAWRNGPHRARLTGDLAARRAVVEWTAADGRIARRDLTSFSSAQTSPLQDPDQPASSPAQPGRPPGLP